MERILLYRFENQEEKDSFEKSCLEKNKKKIAENILICNKDVNEVLIFLTQTLRYQGVQT